MIALGGLMGLAWAMRKLDSVLALRCERMATGTADRMEQTTAPWRDARSLGARRAQRRVLQWDAELGLALVHVWAQR